MAKTNQGLVEYTKKALSDRWGYCLGTFGNTLTQTLLSQKCSQDSGVGTYNMSHRDYLAGFIGKRVSDCYGLVKGYLWMEDNGEPKYSAVQDRNQEGAYNAAKEKGPLPTLPEIPGLVLWMKGHAGIYIGNGELIECAGCPTGVRKGMIKNGAVTSGSKFTHWFKDTYIEYQTAQPVSVVPETEPASIASPSTELKEDTMTQEQFEKMYTRMMNRAGGDYPAEWAKEATELAKKKGVFVGDGNGNYDWQKPMTREAVAVMLWKLGLLA